MRLHVNHVFMYSHISPPEIDGLVPFSGYDLLLTFERRGRREPLGPNKAIVPGGQHAADGSGSGCAVIMNVIILIW